jgi:hypothetical protein
VCCPDSESLSAEKTSDACMALGGSWALLRNGRVPLLHKHEGETLPAQGRSRRLS